jgi:hypothetical protein
VSKYVLIENKDPEATYAAYDEVGDVLNGLSVAQVTFILGCLIADQAEDMTEVSEMCELVKLAAEYCFETDISDTANELPV